MQQMLAAGVDVVEIERIRRAVDRFGDRFLYRIYTELELAFCRGRVPELAARFAGKEAMMKALGTGARGIGWREIEILPDRRGKPIVLLHGRAANRAAVLALEHPEISLSHGRSLAIAFVIAPCDALVDTDAIRHDLTEWLERRKTTVSP